MCECVQTTHYSTVQTCDLLLALLFQKKKKNPVIVSLCLVINAPCNRGCSCSLLLLLMLCSFTGRRKEERRESLPCGDLSTGTMVEASRRPSFLRMVSLGKLKRESMSDKTSQETEEEDEEEPEVKTREPLSGNDLDAPPPTTT